MSTTPQEIIETIKFEAQYAEIDFDAVFADCSGWWHRPFTEQEIEEHPDRERIRATIEAAIRDTIERVCASAAYDLEDEGGEDGREDLRP